jgi:hypothetical protein
MSKKNFIVVFFSQVIVEVKKFLDLCLKYSEEILSGLFYLLTIYFIAMGIYFGVDFIYKVYEICHKLLWDNSYMVNLDLLSTNCAIYGDYESFANMKGGKLIEGFEDTITTNSNTGEKVKTIQGVPIKYWNTNLSSYVDLILADFYWPSSYKTYIPSGINKSKPTYEAIKQAFTKFNVRSVYLDVYSNSSTVGDTGAIPIVRSDSLYYNFEPLDFFKCLQIIKRYGWYDEDKSAMPIILYLNLQFSADSIMYEKIYYAIMKVFYAHIIDKKYSFAGRGGIFPVGKIKMKDAIGKLIVVSNVYPTRTKLDEIINGYAMSGSVSYCYISTNTDDQKDYGGLTVTSSSDDLIDNHKTNIEFMYSDNLDDTSTVSNSKVDLANPDFSDCKSYGVQFVMMSLFLPDTYFYDWYKYFKDNDFKMVLKPTSLRYIATRSNTVTQQNPLLSYQTSTYNMPVSGFFSTEKSGITAS